MSSYLEIKFRLKKATTVGITLHLESTEKVSDLYNVKGFTGVSPFRKRLLVPQRGRD